MTYDVSIETLNTTIPIPHSVYLYVHISLCFTLHVCLAVFFIFFGFISFNFFVFISFTLCMLPLLVVNKDCYINIYFCHSVD